MAMASSRVNKAGVGSLVGSVVGSVVGSPTGSVVGSATGKDTGCTGAGADAVITEADSGATILGPTMATVATAPLLARVTAAAPATVFTVSADNRWLYMVDSLRRCPAGTQSSLPADPARGAFVLVVSAAGGVGLERFGPSAAEALSDSPIRPPR